MFLQRSNQQGIIFALTLALVFLPAFVVSQEADAKPEKSAGISYGLVIDNSGSFRKLLEDVIQFVKIVVEKQTADDESFFVRFIDSEKIKLEQEFTSNTTEILDSAENMYIEAGQTAIVDAVRSSAVYITENARGDESRLRSIVLVTDGDERASISKIDETIQLLKKGRIRVFAVAISDEKVQTKVLDRLTRETGGRLLVMKSRSGLRGAADEVAAAIRKP